MRFLIFVAFVMVPVLLVAQTSMSNTLVRVPFVGCEADGQLGPTTAPAGEGKEIAIPPAAAQRLAYYKAAYGPGVLAPRGWQCFGTYGSNGEALYVSPERITFADLMSAKWEGLTGRAIQILVAYGQTSGRFTVARAIARVFPAHQAFADAVIAEGIQPSSAFPRGPYPHDKLKYRGDDLVEFTTPANSEGLGTMSRLRKNALPIRGVAILYSEGPDLLQLAVRLGREDDELVRVVVQQAELVAGQ